MLVGDFKVSVVVFEITMKTIVVLLAILMPLVKSSPKRGITQHAKILSVPGRVSNCKCNLVANADFILQNLEILRTSARELEKSSEYNHIAAGVHAPIRGMVDSGSIIYTALKNLPQSSSGNIQVLSRNVAATIQQTKVERNEHMIKLQHVKEVLGNRNYKIVRNTHSEFMATLDEIAIENNYLMDNMSTNRASNNIAMLKMNELVKNYGTKLEESVPKLESVMKSVVSSGVLPDLSTVGIRRTFNKARESLRSDLLHVRPYIETNVIANVQANFRDVESKITTQSETVVTQLQQFYEKVNCGCVQETISIVQSISESVTKNVNKFIEQAERIVVRENYTHVLMNESEELVVSLSKNLTRGISQGIIQKSCLTKYQREFDKISQTVYRQSTTCVWDTVFDLKKVATNLNCVFRLALIDLKYEFTSVEKCVLILSNDTTQMALFQAVECIQRARDYLMTRRVYVEQMTTYQTVFRKEVTYSASRYDFCLNSTSAQVAAQVAYLSNAISECGNGQS